MIAADLHRVLQARACEWLHVRTGVVLAIDGARAAADCAATAATACRPDSVYEVAALFHADACRHALSVRRAREAVALILAAELAGGSLWAREAVACALKECDSALELTTEAIRRSAEACARKGEREIGEVLP